ncbi:MAG: protein-glutamate methylesterase/protein-glutamine glutaminase [Fusobacteriota bacterium]
MIKVLVVDDSIFMRNLISDMLNEEKDIEVVGTARNGKDAIQKNKKLNPDVITLDIEMPIMNGLEAVKKIMDTNPTKVIMLSSLAAEGAKETIEALDKGAYDFVQKPSGQISLDIKKVKKELVEKVRESVKVNLKQLEKKPKKRKINLHKFLKRKSKASQKVIRDAKQIVAIGISTGGPNALQTIIPEIPADIGVGILIVQHMPPKFTKSLADRLEVLSEINVKEAEDNDEIIGGTAYIAPGDYHMEVVKKGARRYIRLNQNEPENGHRPSADVLFRSVSKIYGENAVGVIMTGMGGDGSKWLKKLKDTGAKTIGQSKETCVIYGMPKVAFRLGAVDYEVDLERIPKKIIELLKN